tara:strand:- start:6833 stop:7648 length:816 start_codon:yes stop_codon:yes gene_type:complete
MKYDVSILMPAIRTHQWLMMYGSIFNACQEHTWELVLVGPFDLPPEMTRFNNIKLIKDYGAPTRAAQIGAIQCEGEYMYHCVDDAIFLPDAIDNAVNFHRSNCSKKDVINMRYREGAMYSGQTLPMGFWMAHSHPDLRIPGILPHYKISLHPFMRMDYFKELGGWDCQFEYINHPLHDLMFRVQVDGGKVFDSETDATTCNHYINNTGDHKPIAEAQTLFDKPIFDEIYKQKDAALNRIHLDINNWQQTSPIWKRRFKDSKLPKTYKELGY